MSQCASKAMVAAAAPSPAPAPAQAPKAASSKAGDRKVVVPVTAAEVELLEEKHVLAVDGSSVDRAASPRSSAAPSTEVSHRIHFSQTSSESETAWNQEQEAK